MSLDLAALFQSLREKLVAAADRIVNDRDEVEVRRVRVGALDGAMRVVEEGLDPDDRVIVLGVLKARPGAKVTPKVQEALAGRG